MNNNNNNKIDSNINNNSSNVNEGDQSISIYINRWQLINWYQL